MVANIGQTVKDITVKSMRKDLPVFEVGDTIKMKIKVQEADKVRLHPFEGTVIRKIGSSDSGSFTVRKVSFGEGVEKTFPLNSPVIESLKVIHKGIVKRSKLYYLRERIGKKSLVDREQAIQQQSAETVHA